MSARVFMIKEESDRHNNKLLVFDANKQEIILWEN